MDLYSSIKQYTFKHQTIDAWDSKAGRSWGSNGQRGFCKLVLQPLRDIIARLETATQTDMEQLQNLGPLILTYFGDARPLYGSNKLPQQE